MSATTGAATMSNSAGRIEIGQRLVVTRLADGGDLAAGESPLILDHPAVSRRHATFTYRDGRVFLADEQSTNGTFVNRNRIGAAVALIQDDIVEVGPFRLLYDGAGLVRLSRASHAALHVRQVAKDVVRGRDKVPDRILQPLSLTVEPGRVMCIIGASGSGKSTLLNIMAGRFEPSEGSVALGDLDLHAHFAALKQDIAYLPQSETVHELLTVRQALRYAAMLRLPRETAAQVREATIEEAIAAVALQHRIDAPIVSLSGGQRKRACLACEILARPSLLFVDEATSGLDEVTDREVMALLKRLSREGMSIVCVTHTLANLYDYCDDLVVLATGGHLAFAGSVADALHHFGGATLGDVLADLNERQAKPWRSAMAPPEPAKPTSAAAVSAAPKRRGLSLGDTLHQFRVLLHRNVTLLFADRRALFLAGIQSVIVGGLLGYAFADFGEVAVPRWEKSLVLLLGITSLWMGCNSASKDIVGEWHVFRREHDVNLSTLSFVLSKFLVTSALAVTQVLALLLFAGIAIDRIPGGVVAQLPVLVGASLAGVTLGLVISSLCNTRDQASIIVPLAVAPQLILGGDLAPLPGPALDLAKVVSSAYHVRVNMEHIAFPENVAAASAAPLVVQIVVLLASAAAIVAYRARS